MAEPKGHFALSRETASPLFCPRCSCRARALPEDTWRYCQASVVRDGTAYCAVCDLTLGHDDLENANPALDGDLWQLAHERDLLCRECPCGERQAYCIDCETFQELDPAAIAWGNSHERVTTAWDGVSFEVNNDPRQRHLFNDGATDAR